uniref:Type II methyltransferase n=1 Tax=Ignisphaera aggregans TaxID=334771 RepID=A0A7J2U1X7_9CREN
MIKDIVKIVSENGFKFFTTERGVYILGDARDVLKLVPSSSVDVIVTDPPWGVGFDEYDDFKVFLDVRDELYRILKNDSWLVFYFTPKRIYDITSYTQLFEYRWMMPYLLESYGTVSRNPLGGQAGYSIVMVFAKGKPKVKFPRIDVLYADELPVVIEKVREAQFKPTYTTSALLTMFTEEGDVVLDPFAGYGSIPLVCELFNRRWIAVEIDPVKYAVAERVIRERRVVSIRRLKKEIAENKQQRRTLLEFVGVKK